MVFSVTIISVLLSTKPACSQYIPCDPGDSLALVELYNSANGPNWFVQDNWLTGPVCSWAYIKCQYLDTTGYYRVDWVGLAGNNLTGTISPLICNLTYLGYLSIGWNNFSGTIPDCIGNLVQLVAVYVNDNFLTNPIPLGFGSCPELAVIRLDNNLFNDTLPDTITKLHLLGGLLVNNNQFVKVFPATHELDLTALENNRFTFEDILPYRPTGSLTNWTYAPQDSILNNLDTTVVLGSSLTLDSWVDTCQDNKYRWKRGTVYLNPYPLPQSTYTINSIQYSDSGYYSCEVTNWKAFDLTLHRRLIHVNVADSAVGTVEETGQGCPGWRIQYTLAENHLVINLDFKGVQQVKCYLIDALGRKVLRLYEGITDHQELHYYLNRVHIRPGMYIVRLETQGNTITRKVMVE